MATNLTLSTILLMGIISSSAITSPDSISTNVDLKVAIEEMQTANYFSFVMLINMFPLERISGNVTFLMPKDRMLGQISMHENSVYEFLLRHSIPSPLLFDHLEHFPSGSMIPTFEPNFMLRVSNNGRRNFYLNNIQIVSPNICTKGSSIRCHGIKGVLMTTEPEPPCSFHASPPNEAPPTNPQSAVAPTNPLWSPPPPPLISALNPIPMVTPPPIDFEIQSNKSRSSRRLDGGLLHSMTPFLILLMVHFIYSIGKF